MPARDRVAEAEAAPIDVVERALAVLCEMYVFPDKAVVAAAAVRARRDAGGYDGLAEAALAERLTADLFEVCADKHLRVRVRDEDTTPGGVDDAGDADAAWREALRQLNHGIARVERLAGNVGYLDLRLVTTAADGGPAVTAAMELVAHTHALIIDLRRNRGGSPDGVVYWNSYLFPDGGTHLNDIYDAASGETRQYWTAAWLPGARYLDRPVYLLTSGKTFSGGEEFCYNLKAQRRATLIGETTRGGAHPTDVVPLTPTVEITVPNQRSVNPVTGTNWEGVGVEPDVAVPADQAYPVAYRQALEQVLTTSTVPAVLAEARAALTELP